MSSLLKYEFRENSMHLAVADTAAWNQTARSDPARIEGLVSLAYDPKEGTVLRHGPRSLIEGWVLKMASAGRRIGVLHFAPSPQAEATLNRLLGPGRTVRPLLDEMERIKNEDY
jgi:hypothetical protein